LNPDWQVCSNCAFHLRHVLGKMTCINGKSKRCSFEVFGFGRCEEFIPEGRNDQAYNPERGALQDACQAQG